MATAAVQKEELDKILQCSICIDVFTDPRTLPCLHTFCFKCIADWCKDTQPGGKVTCPECREEFVIPDIGIGGLKKNFFIVNLLSMNDRIQKTGDLCEIRVDETGVFSESKHNSMLPVTPTVTDNPQLLFTLDQPPTYRNVPRQVFGVAMLDIYLCVVYSLYNKVQVFSCEYRFKKIKEIEVNKMRQQLDMVGCSVTSQLFVSDCFNGNIWRVNVNTGVSDVFIKLAYNYATLSLAENRLLVTSRDSLLMYDIHFGRRMKNILLSRDMTKFRVYHATESNRDSFFVSHEHSKGKTVSEIDSEGRVIRVFDNKEQLDCVHLALDSVGRLLVADWNNYSVVLLDEHLQFINNLLEKELFDDAWPWRLSYKKNKNRLVVGLNNGHVKIFICHV